MSSLRIVFAAIALAQVAGLVVFVNTAGAELFAVAYSLDFVQNTWVLTALERWELATYTLIIPIFLLDVLIYMAIGGAQDERQRRARAVRRRP